MSNRHSETDRHRLNFAMAVRRWLLILAVPIILFTTIATFPQWQAIWRWLVNN